nr:MAG TPA: cytosine DNA methyltransferase [Caudoviricetes sp.]
MAERPLYTLYKNLKAQNYDVPDDYNKFESALTRDGKGGADNRHAIYENLKAQNFDVPDTYERFYSALFEPRSKTSSRAKGGSVPMTAADRARFSVGAQAISASAQQTMNNAGRYNRLKRRKQKQQKDFGRVNLGTHQTPYGGDANNVVKDDFDYNPETGKAGAYITSDNENVYSLPEAEQKQAILDQQNNAYQQAVDTGEIPSVLDVRDKNGNYDLQENIGKNGTYLTEEGAQKQFDKKLADAYARKKEIEALIAEDNRQYGNPLLSYGASIGASNGRTAEQSDYRNKLATSLALVKQQIGALEAVKQYPTSSWGEDALKALDNTAFTAKAWDFGLTDFATMGQMERIKTKMDNKIPLSGSDKMLLKSKLGADAAAALEDEKMGNIYRWTKIAGQSLPFMADFFLTGGYGGITKGISRGALKIAAKRGMGKVSAAILKNTGIVAGDVIGSYAMAGTEQALKTGADIMQRHLGNLYQDEKGDYKFGTFDENGNLLHEGGESMGTALYRGLTSAMVENYTEKLFGHNYGIKKGAIAAMEKHGMNGTAQFFKNIGKSGWYTNSKKWMEKFGINGFGEEVMEEEIGIPLHALLDGDNKFSDLGDAKQQLDIIGGMAISVGSMYAMGAGSRPVKGVYNRAQYYRFRNKVNLADSDAQNLLGDSWADIKDKIDNATNEQMGSVLADILRQRDTMTKEQINAAVNYGVNLMKMRGYNIAKTAEMNAREITNEPTTPEEQHQADIDNAYSEGHDADDADKHDIQIQQEDQMKTLAAALGISEQQLSAMSDEELESLTGQDDKLDQAIYDYQLSSARYQGVVDDAQDKVDLAAHQAEQRVDMYTDQSRGSVRNATIKASGGLEDYGVYIISGNIATHDDGSIDVSNSDDMILYYDPTTNSVEHADALMFAELGEELPADDVKAQAVADAKENAIKEVAGIIDGTVEVGSQFNVTDTDGTEHTYEVLADYGDGTAAISIDGNVVENPYSLADLQQMKDLEDQKRLEAAKAEREQMEKERAAQQTQETEQTEETQPSFDFNQILNDDGNVVLVDVLDKDGNTKYPDSKLFLIRDAGAKAKVVELKSDGTIVPHAVNKEDVATISSMSLDEYKQAMPESSMIEDNSGENRGEIEVESPTIEGETAAPTEETAATESAETPATEQAPAAPAIALEDGTIVPMLEDGNPDFSKLTAAQTAELYDSQFGEDADSIVSGYVSDAKKALDKASNMTVKGKTFVEQKAAKDAKEKAIADAQSAYDSAIAIRDAYNERQLAKVEDTAEGRKELIEKARRKFARLKSAVKDDAEAVAQIYKETVGTLLHRLYDGTGIDVTDTIPLTSEEYVASNLGAHSLNYEGTETSKGVKQETGLSREDFGKTQLLAADGKGTTIDNLVHSLWENRPSNLDSLDTQDIRNAMLSIITSGFKASEARNYIENLRIAQAENILEEQKKAADNAAFAEENKAESEQQTETAPESEEKAGEENSDEENEKINEQTNENINDNINVPEDATDENPLGAERDESDLPFSAKENGKQQTTAERAADVEKNKVDDMKVVDNIVGEKTRKAFERLAKMMGASIQWQYSDKLGNGWIQETTDADGNVHRTIFITLDSSITEGAQFIFGHEMTHQIKNLNPAAYNELTQLVLDTYGSDAFDKAVDETMKRYSDVGFSGRARDYYAEEVVADAVGEMIRDLNLAHTLAMKMSHPLLAAIHEMLQKIKLAFFGTEYSDVTKNIIRSIEQAYVKTAKGEVTNSETGEDVSFSLRQKPEPKKKGIGYKVFVLKDGKLYPPMVANPDGAETPVGVWLDADAAPIAGESKTGRPQVKQGGKGTQGGSGKLAYRPGWHLGVVPYAIQFNRKDAEGNKTLFPKNFVFAEVEYAADVDYQEEARQEGINPSGKYQHSLAGLKHLPTDGYYMYRTNPNPETDPWVITGAMKVNRILTRAEQAELVKNAGREPQQIQEGDIVTDDVVNSINQEIAAAPKFSLKVYHGSGADFTEFDFDHMSEGEGSQAFGWGGYVTNSKEIGKDYTRRAKSRKANNAHFYANMGSLIANDWYEYFVKTANSESLEDAKEFVLKDLDIEIKVDENKLNRNEIPESKRANIVANLKEEKRIREIIANTKKEDLPNIASANLYEVNIPEDNGSNYLDWDAPITDELIDKVAKALPSLRSYDIKDFKKDRTFDNFYKTISMRSVKDDASFNDDKAASKLLASLGYTGIKYKAGRNFGGAEVGDTNYVIFKPEDMKITEHTKFSLKTYHGTGANFDRFDTSHAYEGAGSETFGHGIYVTKSAKIGASYALKAKVKKIKTPKAFKAIKNGDNWFGRFIDNAVRSSFAKAKKETFNRMDELIKEDENIVNDETKPEWKQNAAQKELADFDKLKSLFEGLTEEDIPSLKRAKANRYEVEIPDDTGNNYLDWNKPMKKEQKKIVREGLEKLGVDVDRLVRNGYSLDKNFGDVYNGLLYYALNGTKFEERDSFVASSNFLSSLGFTGIKYYAGTIWGGAKKGDLNYVIFNEDDAKIVGNTKFSLKSKSVRFEAGKKLSDEEKKEVLSTLKDAYKVNGVPYHIEETAGGKEKRVYEPTADSYVVSDITNRPLRYYITLPDGRVAHPTEVYPNISDNEVKSSANKQGLLDDEIDQIISAAIGNMKDIADNAKAVEILNELQNLPHETHDVGYGLNHARSYNYKTGIFTSDAAQAIDYVVRRMRRKEDVPTEIPAALKKAVADSYGMVDNLIDGMSNTKVGADEIKPVSVGVFGNVYNQFRGKAKAAIEFLKKLGSGEATAALHHHTIGDISLVWGDRKTGLDKILRKHPEVVDNLQSIIDSMEVVQESDNRIKLESPTHFAVVSKEYKGEPREQWLLTAYEKRESLENGKSMDTATSSLGGDTALSQSKESAAKIDNSSETAKENGEKFSLKDEKIKSVAEKFGVNEDDVAMYANAVERGSTADAARARANIKRYLLQANEDKISSFKELMKYTVPVNEALKENFGDLDAMIEERRKQVEAQRNAMEAARKRAQEEEEKRQKHLDELSLIPTDELDKRYMDAIANNDESTAREMLDESARRKGYGDVDSDYQGQGAWAAPSNPQYESDEARRADIENSPDVNLEDIALGYSLQPDDYFDNPRAYMNNTAYGLESAHVIKNALDAIKNGEKDVKVKVYRAVPTSVKEGKLRNGDWVTPSKKYAEMHGDNRLEGTYRIIEDEVPANQLWWDGNDANEFGFDDGKEYRYKNAKNNRKLNDLITYDNKGNVIPPSKRFNSRKNDIRFSLAGERGAAAADKAEERTARMDNLSVARKMEEEKKDAKAIKMATGWERGADGKWRYEMPDAKIKDTMDVGGGHIVKRYEDDMLWNGGKLSEVIDAPELFKAYPQLKDVLIDTDAIMNDMPSNGEYNSKTNTITIHADELKYMNGILNHEIQHAIQDIEGFSKGGSPILVRGEVKKRFDEVTKQIKQLRAEGKEDEAKALIEKNRGLYNAYQKNDDYNSYKSLAGEVEARNVSARLNMTPEERRKSLAESTEDVARKDQIFLGVGDVSFSLRDMADGKESGAADIAEDLKSLNTPDEVDDAIKTAIDDMPSGWQMANKKMIHIAQALGENRKAEIAGEEPKFSLKDGTLIKAGTYFSGGGLVEEGLKGIIDPVVAVEYDEKISGVYRNNFGQHIVTADVRDVDPKELVKQIDGEVEYFHASPVCKNYSQAKSNHAEVELDKETAVSTAEFINAIKPKVVTIENVKGYKDSEAIKTITDALDANGYTWDADVYNAADYGGYTNRERLIVRAVRDGKLPAKPKKMARKSGWYEAVADIIPTLTEKKNGVAPWMDVRLKADGIDWRNIDKPLYVMGSAYADGKIPHAFADELLPTLRTKSGDVIVMPDGKVYRAIGRVLARVSGVSDDYKMPFSENLSHTIIGNGIPTQLTEHVIAPLLTGSDPKFSIRTYHGTGASFDKFDLSHALEGEGSESFGYGVYVTNSSKIGREYAQRAKNRKMEDLYKNMRYPDGVKGDIFKRRLFGEMVNDVATGGSVASAKEFAKKRVGADANDIQRTLENLKDREKGTEYEQNLKDRLAEYKEGLKWIDSLDEDYLTQGNANRYDVDIPDDNGSNYLDWEGIIPDSLDKKKVAEDAYKVVSDNQGFNDFKATPLNDFIAHTLKTYVNTTDVAGRIEKLKSDIKDVIENYVADDDVLALNEYLKDATPDDVLATIWYNDLVRDIKDADLGEELYRKLSTYVGDNAASQILSDNGLVGIKYPAGMIHGGAKEGDYNYVIFDENNANIVGNTRFSLRYDQFEHDLNQWKKDNNLPKDAQRPTIPQRNAGESAVDFLRRVDEYRKMMALWKTAPTYEQHLLSDDTALGEFNRELQRGSVLKRIAFQDSMLAIRKAQEAIMKEVGVDRLNMAEDAYTAENRSHGKGKNEFEEYNNEFLQPLRKAYHQMKKILGDSYDNVRIYMMAKHGLERDAQMAFKKSLDADFEDVAQRSAAYRAYKGDMNRITNDSNLEFGRVDFTTWRQRDNALRTKYSPSYMDYRYDENGIAYDYSGLSALFGGSDFEEAAHKLVRDIESSHVAEVQDLWNATNAATKKILRDGYKAGMMSKDTYLYVRDMYSHYIPLRGWDGTTADQVWDYVGGGKGAFNQTLKTAHGRTSIADDPIAYIENMAESGILLNNKNWVKQHLMLLAQNHPTSLLTLSKAWYVKSTDANGNEEWIPATPQITSQMNSNQVKAAIDAFEQKMENMAQTGDATQKRDGLNIAYPQTHSEEREHEVRVMKDGEEYVIYVNGDPQLAQAMNNTRAHRVREIQSGKLDRAAAWLGRKMAAAYTSLSPLFIPSNYFRDLTMTLASTAIREDGRYNYLLRKNLATSWNLGFMLRDYQNGKLRDKVSNGNATPKEQMFYDFMMNGGETGFVSSLDVEDLKKKFKNDLKDLDRWKTNPVKVGHTIMDGIEFLNRMIEDSNRFAIYMTSIQYGRSIDEAVNDAKDVTLNFNRKGTGEYGWQMIRNLYLFINPAVQSLQTLGALAKHHPFKFTAVTASWLASGVLVPIVNAALMNLLGGDDDKDKYWQFTKWDRRNNLIMWVPFTHEYIKIPLAQEFRAFYGIGDMIASKMMGGELAEESWNQYAEDLLGQVVDMLPLDPTGYDGNIAVSLMPNAIRPVFELAFNVDFTGKPLFKETEYNKYDPNFTKAYVGTPDWLVRASRMVNSIGNDYPDVQQNSIDAFGDPKYNLNNPAVVDHVLSSYLGGAYTMGSQVLGVLTKALNDPKEIKVADIPLFSKFVSNPDDRPVSKKQGDEFWDMKENHDRAANTLSKLKKQAKVDGDYSMLERFYGSEEYKQYKQDDVKVKKYEEDKKKERAEESGDEYRPHKLNAEDIYKAHATPKDDFEDLKLKQLYTKLNGFKSAYDLLVDTAPSQSDGYYNTNKAAIDAIDEISLDKQEISELKKGFLDDGKDAYNAEDMKRIRELRKKILAVLEKANKVVVANQKAKAEK